MMAYEVDHKDVEEEFLDWNLERFVNGDGGEPLDLGLEFFQTDPYVPLHAQIMSLEMQSPATSSDRSSTGYLQDALVDWSTDDRERCNKRRRMVGVEDLGVDQYDDNVFLQELWDWNFHTDPFADVDVQHTVTSSLHPISSSTYCSQTNSTQRASSTHGGEEAKCHSKDTPKQHLSSSSEDDGTAKRRRREREKGGGMVVGITVYPFTVVKPGGIEGDLTLDDINKRIRRKPTRAIRHPVGEFKCLPFVSSVNGRGLSGKAVVGLTRIHTQGTGTITVIRTKD